MNAPCAAIPKHRLEEMSDTIFANDDELSFPSQGGKKRRCGCQQTQNDTCQVVRAESSDVNIRLEKIRQVWIQEDAANKKHPRKNQQCPDDRC